MSTSGRSATIRLFLAMLVVAGLVGGCKSAFRAQAEIVASNIGRNADDVERAFQKALPRATEAELEVAATRSANETSWIKTVGQRVAVEWEQQATLRSVAGATCEYLGLAQELNAAPTEQEFVAVIRNHIRKQGLAPTDAKVLEIAEGIVTQLDALVSSGSVDIDDMLQDLACLPF